MRKVILVISALITLLVAINFGRLALEYRDNPPGQQPNTTVSSTTELVPS